MASIDNRVVSISFDNAAFKTNVDDTIKSLDALKLKLNFADSSASFSDISKAAQKVDLGAIASAVDTISGKFSAMGVVAFTVLQNIVNQALNAGKNLASALSLGPITGGFQEYETNLNSIQTILANTSSQGTNLQDVNSALQTLNEYSDQTIYNFSQMARNIGTFTAAGVDLDTSTAAIKGIANLAAVSGSSSEQASVAMYQLSQAIASGTVRLMDWNSVQNAGMGGAVFQKALFETGKTLGTIADVPIGMTFEEWTDAGNTFRGSLESGWLTSEVLTQTLQGFTGDLTEAQIKALGYTDAQTAEIMKMGEVAKAAATEVKTVTQLFGTIKEAIGSGWSQSFSIIVGDFEEAKALFTNVNNVIGESIKKSAEARNELLSKWKDLGGRTLLIQALADAFKGLGTILTPIKEAFRDIFPKKTAMDLLRLTQQFADFTRSIAISGDTADAIKGIFKGIFSVFKIGIEIVKGIFSLFTNIFGLFSGAGGGLLSFFGSIGDGVSKLSDSLVGGNKISDFFDSIFKSIENLKNKINIQPLIDKLNSVKDAILGIFGGGSDSAASSSKEGGKEVTSIFDKLASALSKIGDFGGSVANTIETIFNKLVSFGQKVVSAIGQVWDALKSVFTGANFDRALQGAGIGLFGGLLLLIKGFLNNGLAGLFAGNDLIKAMTKVFGGLEGVLSALQTNIKADALLKIAYALGILTISIIALSFVDPIKVGTGLAAMAGGVAILSKAMIGLTKVGLAPGTRLNIIALALSMGLLAGAVLLLSVSALILSKIDLLSLATGMAAIYLFLKMMGELAGELDKKANDLIRAGFSIGIIAASMLVLALAVFMFSLMDLSTIAIGLGTVAAALTGIVASMKLMPKGTDMVNVGAGILLIAISMLVLAGAVKLFAMMNIWELIQGIGAIATMLGALGLALEAMPEKDMVRIGYTLLIISVAMNLMARALTQVAAIPFEDLIKSIIAFGGVFFFLGVALKGFEKSGLAGGLGLLLVSYGLGKLVDAIILLGGVGWGTIGKSLLVFAIVLTAIGVAGVLLKEAIVGVLGFGAAVFLFGAGLALAALSMKLFAEGIILLVKAGETGLGFFLKNLDDILGVIPKIAASLAKGLYSFAIAFLEGAPALLSVLGKVILSIIELARTFIPKLGQLIVEFVAELIRVVDEIAPDLIDVGFKLLIKFLSGISENIGTITTLVSEIIVKFLDSLTEMLPDIVQSGAEFLAAMISGLADNLDTLGPAVIDLVVAFITFLGESGEDIITAGGTMIANLITGLGNAAEYIVTAGFDALVSFIEGISENIQMVIDKGFQIVIDFLNGVADSIDKNEDALGDAGINLLEAIIKGVVKQSAKLSMFFLLLPFKVIGWIGDVLNLDGIIQKGKDLINAIGNGIDKAWEEVKKFFTNLGTTIINYLNGADTWLSDIGRYIVEGLWAGIQGAKKWFLDQLGWFADLIPDWVKDILGISSPSKVFMEIGDNIGLGLGYGIRDSVIYTSKASQELGKSVVDNFYVDDEALSDQTIRSINDAMIRVADNIQNMDEMTPIITPVIDLTNIQNGARQVNGMFSVSPLSTDVSYGGAQSISSAEAQRMADAASASTSTGDVNFSQIINSPTALSTNDIYRQTRSQIALAKKELSLL